MCLRLLLIILPATLVIAKYAELAPWAGAGVTRADEALDERRDAELLAAVRASVREWQHKKARTRSKRSQGSVCYDDLGCFEDSGPFGYLETLPSPPQEINTHFLLYSTISRGDQPLLAVSARNMSAAWSWAVRAFDAAKPTRVIVHGFGASCDNVWVYEMRSALMAVEECNVVCVDWEGGAVMPNYLRAAANTRLVATQLALLLQGLAKYINLKIEDVHLIGFSLGAHVAGYTGSLLGNISRITGLDPAGPLFEFQDPRARLDSSDAKFVDVIHSNGENLILGGLGSWQPMGHVDFYPNGGRMQTGCSNLFAGAVADIIWSSAVEGRSLCNHRRAYKFFTDSVSPKCHFPAFPCGSYDEFLGGRCFPCGNGRRCGNMGYYADRSIGRGQLYLVTRDEEPFCAHQYHVTVQSSKTGGPASSYGKITLALVGDSGLNESFPMTKKDDSELVVGAALGRMVVPHPALGVPLRAQLLYKAYSGWLSAGHQRWTVDKILISDSFGKKSSFCKKGLELISEEPVNIPLYPGDCHIPETSKESNATVASNITENQVPDDIQTRRTPFIPTQVVKIGDELIPKLTEIKDNGQESKLILRKSEFKTKREPQKDVDNPGSNIITMGQSYKINDTNKVTTEKLFSIFDAAEILNIPWQPLVANSLDDSPNEREVGRAFGVTNVKPIQVFQTKEGRLNQRSPAVEIVEPVLKARPTKNGRSQGSNESIKEISEPVLRATTDTSENRIISPNKKQDKRSDRNRHPKNFDEDSTAEDSHENEKPIDERTNTTSWIPALSLLSPAALWNRFSGGDSKANSTVINSTQSSETFNLFQWNNRKANDNGTNTSLTVQFLPTRLVSFLEKAERYARNTILPLVSAYTPRFLQFGGQNTTDTKYIPVKTTESIQNTVIPMQSQEEKIEILKGMGPPGSNYSDLLKLPDVKNISIEDESNVTNIDRVDDEKIVLYNEPGTDPIKIVDPPNISTTTALPPVTVQSAINSSEKVIIVYPSNARDDRKVQSHSFSEIMQFEALYLQTVSPGVPRDETSQLNQVEGRGHHEEIVTESLRINLPTYQPPRVTTAYPFLNASTPNFIPVSYPTNSNEDVDS